MLKEPSLQEDCLIAGPLVHCWPHDSREITVAQGRISLLHPQQPILQINDIVQLLVQLSDKRLSLHL